VATVAAAVAAACYQLPVRRHAAARAFDHAHSRSHLPIQRVPHRDKRWQTSKQYPTRLNVLHPSLMHNGEHSAIPFDVLYFN